MNYALNEQKMFCDITDGIAIVINSETGIYYGMNNFSTAVFDNITKGIPVENILTALRKITGAPADLDRRLDLFIKALLKKEILVKGSLGAGQAVIDAEKAAADGFMLDVKEYNDAQELLLADPIHEVKEETGWKPEKRALEKNKRKVKTKHAKIGTGLKKTKPKTIKGKKKK